MSTRLPSRRPVPIIAPLFLAVLLLGPKSSYAQYNTAEIGGVVQDAQGGALPGASVSATRKAGQ